MLSLAALLLRRLGDPSAERRGAGLEFWGSNSSSGMTSSQRAPRKPERHTQSWGRLQDPRFWQGGWHTAGETGRGMRAGAAVGGLMLSCQEGHLLPHSDRKPHSGLRKLLGWICRPSIHRSPGRGYPVISEQPIRD